MSSSIKAAERVLDLINSSPRTPTKEEIAAVIAGASKNHAHRWSQADAQPIQIVPSRHDQLTTYAVWVRGGVRTRVRLP